MEKDKFASDIVKMVTKMFDEPYNKDNMQFDNVKALKYYYVNDKHPYHKLKILYPDNLSGKLPLIIDVHGGAWMSGDYDSNLFINSYLASKGFIVASMSYRLLPEFKVYNQIRDVHQAIEFISKLDLDIDFNNVFLMGDSAGGHLAMLHKAINDSEYLQDLFSLHHIDIHYNGIILNHPAPDIDHTIKGPLLMSYCVNALFKRVLYGRHYNRKQYYKHTSLFGFVGYIKPDTPFYIVSSRGDNIAFGQVRTIRKAFAKEGISYDCYIEPSKKMAHVFNIMNICGKEAKKCNDAIAKFFKEHLKFRRIDQ